MTARRTMRWNIALAGALLTSGVGVLVDEPTLLLLSVPGVVFAAYSHATEPPTPTLEIERSLAATDPSHGDAVEVTVTLRNTGERTLPNVSIVDGIPPMLSVQVGAARHAAALGPGDETTFSYTVAAKHGIHRFRAATVVLEDASGSVAIETTISDETELTCRSPVQTVSLGRIAHPHIGTPLTADDGRGTEFSKIRSYRHGDPPTRIDWNRYARDGDLTTVSFRDDRSRALVLCLDARVSCYYSSGSGEPHAVLYERAAARELLETATDSGEPVGLAVFGTEYRWTAPNTGTHHIATMKRMLEDTEVLPLEPPGHGRGGAGALTARVLRTRIESGTSVVFLSPLLDDAPLEAARTLDADDHSVTVLSPDVTTTGSLGTELARLQRENRLGALRRANISVIDWNPETELEVAIRNGVNR